MASKWINVDIEIEDDLLAQQEFADEHLTPADVLARIEEYVAEFVNDLALGKIPDLELVSRGKANAYYKSPESQQAGVAAALGGLRQTRSFLANQGGSSHAYLRVFMMIQTMHQLLRSGCTTTQRDLYYKLQPTKPALFQAPKDVDVAIQDVVALLKVPRSSLGITCASRGAMAGQVQVRDNPTAPWQDCCLLGSAGKAIPGSLAAIEAMGIRSTARYLLIVEKDAVFQRLIEDKLFNALPCVMVTAKGMPDVATRALCTKIVSLCPGIVVLGMVDYNPHGVCILRTYKFGSHRMGLECHKYALPGLHWLGLRSGWLIDVDADNLHELTSRDTSVLSGVKASLEAVCSGSTLAEQERSQQVHAVGGPAGSRRQAVSIAGAGLVGQQGRYEDAQDGCTAQVRRWIRELDTMQEIGYKADIESLYSIVGYEGLRDLIVQAIERGQFI